MDNNILFVLVSLARIAKIIMRANMDDIRAMKNLIIILYFSTKYKKNQRNAKKPGIT